MFSVKLPPSICTTQVAEIASLAIALERTESTEELIITCSPKSTITGLVKNLQRWEDRGWIHTQNSNLLKKVAAELCRWSGDTKFRLARKEEEANTKALKCTRDGVRGANEATLDLTLPANFDVMGAKLSAMTQALLYQGIMEQKTTPVRQGTVIKLDMT